MPSSRRKREEKSVEQSSTFEARIGTGQAGGGAFFGPLVVAATRAGPREARALAHQEVHKHRWWSKERTLEVAKRIRTIAPFEVVRISPKRYNEILKGKKTGKGKKTSKGKKTRKDLAAWAHARAIEALAERYPEVALVVTDQLSVKHATHKGLFAGARHIRQVATWGADADPAAAAAAILARAAYIEALVALSETVGLSLPTDSDEVLKAARAVHGKHGWPGLASVAKLDFRIAERVTG